MRSPLNFFAGIFLLASLASCNMGADIFTQKELDKMYSLDVTQADKALSPGLPLDNSRLIDLSLTIMPGALSPSFIKVLLLDSGNAEQASISFAKKSADPNLADKFIVVASFDDPLPPLMLPAKLASGYYILSTQILDQDGAILSVIDTPILVYDLSAPQISISLYPAQLNAARSALFKAALSGPVTESAWISWKIDGLAYSEGFVSEGYDRIIWTAPLEKGIHSITADFFPYKPFGDQPVRPLVSGSITAPVVLPFVSEIAIPLKKPYVAFNFNKGIDNSGSQTFSELNIVGNKPVPEEFSSGYGFILGNGNGISSNTPMIPWSGAEQGDFSMLFSTAALYEGSSDLANREDSGAVLFSSFDSSGTLAFQLGLSGGIPYIKTDSRVDAVSAVPRGIGTVVFTFRAAGGFLGASIYIDGRFAGSGQIKDFRTGTSGGMSKLAGTAGYKAVYNDFSVYDYLLPAYAASMAALYPDTLIYAISADDAESIAPNSARLGRSPLAVNIPAKTNRFKLELKIRGNAPDVSIVLDDGRSILVTGSGAVLFEEKVLGQLQGSAENSTMRLVIERQNESILVSNDSRESSIAVPVIDSSFTGLNIGSADAEIQSFLMLNLPK